MRTVILFIALSCIAQKGHSAVTVYRDINNPLQARQAWFNAAGPISEVDFTGFAPNTIITNQYAHLGVTFTDGTDRIHFAGSYLEDGVGLNGAFDESSLAFAQPMHTLAFDYPGNIQFVLYSGAQAIFDSGIVFGGGAGAFVGIISTQSFDSVEITDPTLGLVYDTLYFGAPIPAPAGLAALLAGLLARPGRRRPTRVTA